MIALIRTLLGRCPTCGAPYDKQEDHIDGHLSWPVSSSGVSFWHAYHTSARITPRMD